MTKQELKKLKKSLPKGWAKDISEKFVKTEAYVRMVINGQRDNIQILSAAVVLAEKAKEESENLKLKINSL